MQSCSCQCTLCRKFTGSLIAHDLILKPTQLTLDTSVPTYKEYESSAGGHRSFCSACGSGLTWRLDYVPDMLVVFLGTVDEEYLLGKKLEEGKFDGGLMKELTDMHLGHLFWDNRVAGVTDQETLNGPKYPQSFPME
jgi:hypothetical protein